MSMEKFKKDEVSKKSDQHKDFLRLQAEVQNLKDYQLPQLTLKHSKLEEIASGEMINEVKNALSKMFESKITDVEFNLNNKIVGHYLSELLRIIGYQN